MNISPGVKILVTIANYGTRAMKHLEVLLRHYRAMPWPVRLVVLSNIPKELGPDVEVLVGLPEKDPRSLPFGYKQVMARHAQEFDLFIYTEDDVLITEQNIRAFLRVTEVLPSEYVAGFLRTEVSAEGTRYYSTIHAHYHWDPNSVLRAGEFTFARYTNDHAGSFLLTRAQLARALASGHFLRGFRKGRYGYLETAATDPFTQCGLKKTICISHLQDFCLPHLANVYCGRIGLEAGIVHREVAALLALNGSAHPRGPLFEPETGLDWSDWDKQYYEPARDDILCLVPASSRRVLSIGCGWGETEGKMLARGLEVSVVPLDCVIAMTAEARGLRVLPPDLWLARKQLEDERFDCIVFSDTLHRFAQPVAVLKSFVQLLAAGGTVVVSAPNGHHARVLLDAAMGKLDVAPWRKAQTFTRYGFHFTSAGTLRRWLRQAGLAPRQWCRKVTPHLGRLDRAFLGMLRPWLAPSLVVAGQNNG